jgi:hypothetical protein
MNITPGATSQSLTVQIVDDTGLPVTGLVAATFPSTYYERVAESAVEITPLTDLAAINSAYSSGGVKEVNGGRYRIDVPDAAFATASKVTIIGEATDKRILHPVINVAKTAATIAAGDLATDSITAAAVKADAATKIATAFANLAWIGNISAGTFGRLILVSAAGVETTATGTPTTTSIQLTAGSTTDDFYNDQTLMILDGVGQGQAKIITDYVGATRTCTFDEAFVTAPASGDSVVVRMIHTHPVSQIQAGLATPTNITSASGVSLAATGLDAITVTAPSTVATTFPAMVVQVWRRFFNKSTLTSTELKTYADNGTTVVTTQAVSDDGTTQTQGAAT